jgi:hypothetical protein
VIETNIDLLINRRFPNSSGTNLPRTTGPHLVAENRFTKNKTKPRLAFIPLDRQLTIDQLNRSVS